MRDKTLGGFLLAMSILAMLGYFYWLFLAPHDLIVLGRPISEWALIVPILIIVYAFLFIVAWIGWAMASTPPPLPLTEEAPREKAEPERDEQEHRVHTHVDTNLLFRNSQIGKGLSTKA